MFDEVVGEATFRGDITGRRKNGRCFAIVLNSKRFTISE